MATPPYVPGTFLNPYVNKKQVQPGAQPGAATTPAAQPAPGATAQPGGILFNAYRQVQDNLAQLAPADTYGAQLRELSRIRVQRTMRNTNGQAGSTAGIV